MSVNEDLLMAYADGELEAAEHAAERAAVEAALKADPAMASRVEQHRALRRQLEATFEGVLVETIPDRLMAVVHAAPGAASEATVTDLNRVREAKAAESAARSTRKPPGRAWVQWGAIAASLVMGAVIGHVMLESPESGSLVTRGGRLVAQGSLDRALSNQLAGDQAATSPVQIGVSFKSRSGSYCRTFVLHDVQSMGGVACHEGDSWQVHALAHAEKPVGSEGGYRPAGSEIPAAVRTEVEEQIVGEPLDAAAEAQAKKSAWQ